MIQAQDYKQYLIPSVVAKLGNLELKARLVVEGFMAGLHKSPYHGFSVEFAEHRQYMFGDDLKYLDWKVFARTDRYYIKQFEEETNLKSYIMLDISRSMDFSSSDQNSLHTDSTTGIFNRFFGRKSVSPLLNSEKVRMKKLEYASYIAASLAYLMIMQKDAVSLTTYDTKVRNHIHAKSTKSNLKLILNELNSIKPDSKTGTASSLNEIASKMKRRGLIIVISDFFDDINEVMNALKHFRYKKNEVVIFQVLDPVEMTFAKGNAVTLVDLETKEEMYSQPYAMQRSYQEAIIEFLDKIKTECRKNNIDYELLSTETPFDTALLKYLTKRKRMI